MKDKILDNRLSELHELLEHLSQARRNLDEAIYRSDISDLEHFNLEEAMSLTQGAIEEFKASLTKWSYKSGVVEM